ncbi:MAG TPA: class I SAM-dependent methyltransferase [Polyangiaceae bacterium]|nr:class I SAM-dependent methyltransferase [Polyangiaceae bacterium]
MAHDNFCIRTQYIARSTALTHEGTSGETYWTAARIRAADTYQWGVYALAERELRRRAARTVVDVGCGPAPKLAALQKRNPDVSFIGIDQGSAVTYCRGHYQWGDWLEEDLANPKQTPSDIQGDVVICADVIEHVLDPDVLLDYLKQHVTPCGLLIISTPDRDLLRGPNCTQSPNPQHVREWNGEEFKRYLQSRGLRVTRQIRQLPIRLRLGRPLLDELILRAVRGQPLRYNQVCLAEVS